MAAVLAVLLVGWDEEPTPTEARPRPELHPLVVGERVWAAEGAPSLLHDWRTGRLRDGRLLVGTEDGIELVDVESGAALWAQHNEAKLPGQTVALDPKRCASSMTGSAVGFWRGSVRIVRLRRHAQRVAASWTVARSRPRDAVTAGTVQPRVDRVSLSLPSATAASRRSRRDRRPPSGMW